MFGRLALWVVLPLLIFVVACEGLSLPTHTPYATQMPYPTSTPYPTNTPYPTYTPVPTATSTPTATFTSTSTNTPSPTDTPLATATNTPAPSPTRPLPTATPYIVREYSEKDDRGNVVMVTQWSDGRFTSRLVATPALPLLSLPLNRELQVGVDVASLRRGQQRPVVTGLAQNLSSTWDAVDIYMVIRFTDSAGNEVFKGEKYGLDIRAGDRAFWSIELQPTGPVAPWELWGCAAVWQWREVSSGRLSEMQGKSCVRE